MDSGIGYQFEESTLTRDGSMHSDKDGSGVVKQLVEKFQTLEDEHKDDMEEQLAALHEQRRSQEWKYRNPGQPGSGMFDDAGNERYFEDGARENGSGSYFNEEGKQAYDRDDQTPWQGSGGLYETGFSEDVPVPRDSEPQDVYQQREPEQPLLEWRRKRAIELREKEVAEEAARRRLMEEGHDYIDRFLYDRTRSTETAHTNNKHKEEALMAELDNLHANADKNYWAAVLELVDFNFNKSEDSSSRSKSKAAARAKAAAASQISTAPGGKPGKATDMARMRQVLLKLKHHPIKTTLPPKQEKPEKRVSVR